MSNPLVAIVVLSWNGKEDTLECLKSLQDVQYPNFKTILVDNGSTDGTREAVRSEYPAVDIVDNGENIGVAEGNNAGLKRALEIGADAMLLLNNDTTLDPPFLTHLVESLYQSPDIAGTNPIIYYYDEPDVIWSAGGDIDEKTGIVYQRELNEKDTGQLKREINIDYGISAALLIRREALEKVGMMDPAYFIYYDETDWCMRARRAGYRIVLVPEAKIWHKVSKVMNQNSAAQLYYFCRNRLLFMSKHCAGRPQLLKTATLEFGRMSASFARKKQMKQSRAVRKAIVDFYRGRFGKARL